jgi:TonB-linked SusC/RagA family outer membrane protein
MPNHYQQLKKLILIVLAFSMPAGLVAQQFALANSMGPVITTNQDNQVALVQVLKQVEQKFHVHFNYDGKLLNGVFTSSSENNTDHSSVEEALDYLLKPLSLRYEKLEKDYYLIYPEPNLNQIENLEKKRDLPKDSNDNNGSFNLQIIRPYSSNLVAFGQQQVRQITGKVTIAEDGEPLPGVNVIEKGTTNGTVSSTDGEYLITVNPGATLIFSSVGYLSTEQEIGNRTVIDIAMATDIKQLQELVVVGYGTQRKEAISGSVGTVQGDLLAEQPSIQTSAALMGLVPGVQVTQLSGQPGANKGTIRIRGIGTLGDSNPLVLIDGISGSIDDVPSSDIESISILKDASAAAIYGSRGANGVILVTTKRGKEEPMRINYFNNIGFQRPTNQPGFVDGGTFMRMENLGADNLGVARRWSDEFIQQWEANHRTDPDNYPNTNWINEVFTEQAVQQMHNLSISGGGTNYRFRGSMQYDDETAQIPNFRFQRYNMRLNTDVNVTNKLSLTFDVNAIRNNHREPSAGLELITRQTYRLSPLLMARFSDGSIAPGMAGDRNPVAEVENGGLATVENNIFRGRIGWKFVPVDGLQFNLIYSPATTMSWNKNMRKQWKVMDPRTGQITSTFPAKNSLEEALNRNNQHTAIFTVDFNQNIADHRFNVLGGSEYIDYGSNYFGASRDNFTLQEFEQLNAGSSANQQNFGSATQWRLLSFFGRLDYNYKNKYLLLSNLRYDGSSRFTADKRWGFFPSFSMAWRLSEEPFMNAAGFINDFKIRGSWGVIGNQSIGDFPFAAVVNLGHNFIFGDQVADGAAQTNLANRNITWEETTTTNLGLDMYLFNDRIDIKFDWFNRRTSDILLQLPMPFIIGMNPPYQNAGVVENKGWEIEAGFNNKLGSDVIYSISFNVSNVKNKVVDLYGAGPFISGNTIIKEGHPINSIYGLVSDGLFKSTEEIDNHARQSGKIAPGDIKYRDLSGDGIISPADRDIIGNPFPSFNYGFNISAGFRNFHLSALFQGVGSRDVLLRGETVWAFENGGRIQPWQVESYWRPESPDNTYPRLTTTTSHSNFQASDFWVYDASYLRLRNLQLSFDLPEKWIGSIVRHARLYVAGQNLFTLFNKMPPGVDPNVPNNTVGNYFPINKLYSSGININF